MNSVTSKIIKLTGTVLTAVMAAVFFAVPVFCLSDNHSLPINAKSAILICADNDRVIYSLNKNERLPMASTTKIMTAIIALEHGDIDKVVNIPDSAIGVEGSSIYLRPGEHLTVRQLVYALMLASANDAAEAIAVVIAGSVEAFADLMNQKAECLGLENTHFDNPHGLDSASHYTTAEDLACLTAYCMKNPDFCRIVSTVSATIPLDRSDGVRYLHNHNKMLIRYNGANGVKTGFTKRSGRCLVSSAERNNVSLIAVTLSDPDDWNDHALLLDYGFSNLVSVCSCDKGELCFNIPVTGGASDCVTVANSLPYNAVIPKCHGEVSEQVELPHFLTAPVVCGQTVGYKVFSCDGKEILRVPLNACYSVE